LSWINPQTRSSRTPGFGLANFPVTSRARWSRSDRFGPPYTPIPAAAALNPDSQRSAPPRPAQAQAAQANPPAQTPSARAGTTHELTQKPEPFSFADFTWLTGNPRTNVSPLETKAFTGEVRVDFVDVQDFNHPKDNSIGGSSEIFRSNE